MHCPSVNNVIRNSSFQHNRQPFKDWIFDLGNRPYPNIVEAFLLIMDGLSSVNR
jgi:hypothetical protein